VAPVELSDEVLAVRVASGDVRAFGALYDRYARRVHGWAQHALGPAGADDAVQEIFLRVWRSAGQFDPRRGPMSRWLFAIVRNYIATELVRQGRQGQRVAAQEIDRVLCGAIDQSIDVGEQAVTNAEGAAVLRALRDVPADQRRVLVMAHFAGMSQSMIAAELGVPWGTVKKRVRLGMQKLRAALAAQGAAAPLLKVVNEE
jgi:RNA polymerase sigma-70 factor (ECF subfamily)